MRAGIVFICLLSMVTVNAADKREKDKLFFNVTVNNSNEQNTMNSNLLNLFHRMFHPKIQRADPVIMDAPEPEPSTAERLVQHKKIITLGACIAGYFICKVLIARLTASLGHKEFWSLWHWEKPMEALIKVSQQELAQELLMTIQQRYKNYNKPDDFITPMITFMKDVEEEAYALHSYIRFYELLRRFHVERLFAINHDLLAESQERLKRLSYIKNLFDAWKDNYKLTHRHSILKESDDSSTMIEEFKCWYQKVNDAILRLW